MTAASDASPRVGFAVGTGRCGTHFLSRLFAREPSVAASHERHRMNEAFHRYCRWYNLPVDSGGFLTIKETEIRADLRVHAFSFEASAYLSLSIRELFERFGARFVLMIRRPEEIVNSLWSKGWYERPYVQTDPYKALGFQDLGDPHHFFSRFAPTGDPLPRWNALTRVGKIAWHWNAVNLAVWEQFQRLPATHWRVVKLEEMSFQTYQDLVAFFGLTPTLSEARYDQLAARRPGRRDRTYRLADWSPEEIAEFETQVRPAAELFGYEYRFARLPRPARNAGVRTGAPRLPALLRRLGRMTRLGQTRARGHSHR